MLKERYLPGKKARLVAAFTAALGAGIAYAPVSAGENAQAPTDTPIEIQSNYPEVVGNLEMYGIEIQNNNKEARLVISDEDLEYIRDLTEKYGTKVRIRVLEEYISDIPTEKALAVQPAQNIYFYDELVEPGLIEATLAWNKTFLDSLDTMRDLVPYSLEEINSEKISIAIAAEIYTSRPYSDLTDRTLLRPLPGLIISKDIAGMFEPAKITLSLS